MLKKLEKAVAELEQRTNTKMRFCDYDDIQGGVQSISDGNKYTLWLCAVKTDHGYMYVGTHGKVLGRFRTQAEALELINSGTFDNI
nr:MAG TPA: hypothetical protein [Caudoviricetes sp.]